MNKILSALLAGGIFGVGITLSGMVDPNKVVNFLDITGNWDPSLMFVLGGAVITTTVMYRFVFARGKPIFDEDFHLPTVLKIDARLLIGSALFGIGWGLIGYCPGPVVASLGFRLEEPLIVVVSMLAGLLLYKVTSKV
ncbi:MAG: transporter [Cycloclasticus sp.]|nr:transporter [Cycloclasticus sp.]MBG95793.1 transporter [Cycloclasticus sp.]HAI96613.1 transporter [Methylococcaceae bacterium]|tara:strand:- start:568 stop:981 length:414 start_codon:yes stop_codon:yes gene_type:complete